MLDDFPGVAADGVWKGHVPLGFGAFKATFPKKVFYPSTPSMKKVDDGEKKRCFSGHYVIASSLPPERRPLERRTLVPIQDKSKCETLLKKMP